MRVFELSLRGEKTRKIGSRLRICPRDFSRSRRDGGQRIYRKNIAGSGKPLGAYFTNSQRKMPEATGDIDSSGKRKRTLSDKRPSKRARSESSEEDVQAQILLLESEIFEAKKNYNNVSKLIKILRDENEDTENSAVAAISLCRVFVRLIAAGDMVRRQTSTEKDVIVIRWLKERYSEYKHSLLLLLDEESLESTALTLCMRLLKSEGEHLLNGQEYNFPTSFLSQIVQVILGPDSSEAIRAEFGMKYVEEYDDIRFYTFKAVK